MRHPKTTTRLGRSRMALAALALAAPLAFASGASAAVFTPLNGPQLQAAISSANSNPGNDTIKLAGVQYLPLLPMTITDAAGLTITGDHAAQAALGGPVIDGGNVVPLQADMLTIAVGASARLEGFTITTASEQPFAAVRNRGTLRVEGMLLSGNSGAAIANVSGANAAINNSSVVDNLAPGVSVPNGAIATFNNSTVANNSNGGVTRGSSGNVTLNNTIVANNDPNGLGLRDCSLAVNTTTGSLDSDNTCGVAIPATDPLLFAQDLNGGPTATLALDPTSPAINAANPAQCPTVDQRFFVRDANCDIGAYDTTALQDTTPATCVVTALRNGPPKQQDVTAADTGSGLGPAAITDVTIANGSVAFTPFTQPSRSGLVLTATKTDQLLITQWSFTATDWAGNVKDCR